MRFTEVYFLFIILLHTAIILMVIPGTRCGSDMRQLEKKLLDNLTNVARYDKRLRPAGENNSDGPVVVRTNMYIRSISKIDENSMEYSVQLTFRQAWTDSRLQFEDFGGKLRYLTLTDANIIWKPDLFFSNENRGHMHNLIQPNNLIRIFPDGKVLYSVRISLVLSCPMDLTYFPFDTQTCSIVMASYGYTTEDIVLLWKEGDPIQITRNLKLLTFNLNQFMTSYCTSRTNTGEYSCLKVDLVFKRVSTYYVHQTYIPVGMFVLLSWVIFWIDKNQVAIRFSLVMVAMIAIAIMSKGNNVSTAKTSYMKAIDVWTAACQIFVFAALLESATVNYVDRKNKYQNLEMENAIGDPATLLEVNHSKNCNTVEKAQPKEMPVWHEWVAKFTQKSPKIDIISRVLFPVMFVIFNIVYWTTYSTSVSKE